MPAWHELGMRKAIALLCLLASACTNDDDTVRTLKIAGYTDISITGWAPMSCSGVTALNPLGKPASGVVCCGLVFKSCTIRF